MSIAVWSTCSIMGQRIDQSTADRVAEWKSNRETSKLQNRADKAERYAAATIAVALAAVDEAEQAAIEAWLTRQDANSPLAQ
jgi:hypothetical protein